MMVFLFLFSTDSHEIPQAIPISHEVYVWQRQWTPSLKEALFISAPWIKTWHVLGAEVGRRGQIYPVAIDSTALLKTGKPVILVIRINGQLTGWESEAIIRTSLALVADWRKSGIPVIGLEIDHDCATSRLADYTKFLGQLRQASIGQDLSLHITTLPAWLNAPTLVNLLKQVDEAVLQVHSVSNPQHGLFDPKQAEAWVKRFSEISPVKFRVALPTYGSRIAWDKKGRVLAVESEVTMGLINEYTRELTVKPESVATLLETWQQQIPKRFNGTVWFRLPTADDQRAWSINTWKAVMDGHRLQPKFVVQAVPSKYQGVLDIFVTNESDIDGLVPKEIHIVSPQRCSAADAINTYQMMQLQQDVQFHLSQPLTLRAHHRSIIGWVRCPNNEVNVYVSP